MVKKFLLLHNSYDIPDIIQLLVWGFCLDKNKIAESDAVGLKAQPTVLGAQNAVWQFKEISQQEVKNNFSAKNKLYFYKNF